MSKTAPIRTITLLKRLAYITTWLPGYSVRDLRGDLLAGLTVGVMLIPQSMAYALLAGLPPIYGLYASLVPLLIYPLFGTSQDLAVGTIAIDMLIVAAGLSALAEAGSARYIELAILLAAMVGLVQIMMAAAQMGFLVNLLSRPVIAGFTSAAALIIVFTQLGSLLGLDLSRSLHIHALLWEAFRHAGDVHGLTLGIGLASVAVLLGLKFWKPFFPAPLVVVVLGTALVWWLHLDRQGVAILGDIPTGLPAPALPVVDTGAFRALVPTAVTLALVQFMTVISLGKIFAARHRSSIQPNRELFAIGASNLIGSVFRSFPISGSFSRTAVNAETGARTPLTNVVAAALIALTLLFLTPLFSHLPTPVLAAIIIVAALGLFDLKELRTLLRIKRVDGGIALLTFLITLFVGIREGVLIGIAASVVAIMYRISRPNVAELGHLPGTRSFRDVRRNARAEALEGLLIVRVDASFSFANADFLKDRLLRRIRRDPTIRAVVVDASSINDLDTTAAAALLTTAEILQARGIDLYFGGVKDPVRDVMRKCGLYEQLGRGHFFLSPHRAVKHILAHQGKAWTFLEDVPGAPNP